MIKNINSILKIDAVLLNIDVVFGFIPFKLPLSCPKYDICWFADFQAPAWELAQY
jgi:hypothetical protein